MVQFLSLCLMTAVPSKPVLLPTTQRDHVADNIEGYAELHKANGGWRTTFYVLVGGDGWKDVKVEGKEEQGENMYEKKIGG